MGRPRRRRRSQGSLRSSVRVTRTRGSGSNETTSYRTNGLYVTGVGPTGRVAGSHLTVWATVRGEGVSLSKEGIRLYVDGSEKTRSRYDGASGRLSYYAGALPPGTHRVEVQAGAESGDDRGGSSGTARKGWTFSVVKG